MKKIQFSSIALQSDGKSELLSIFAFNYISNLENKMLISISFGNLRDINAFVRCYLFGKYCVILTYNDSKHL